MAARSEAHVCGLSRVEIVGSNPAGGIDGYLLCVVRYRSLGRAYHSSRGVLPSVMCLSVIVKPRKLGDRGPLGALAPWEEIQDISCTIRSYMQPYFETIFEVPWRCKSQI